MNIAAFVRFSGLVAIMAAVLNVLSGMPDQIPKRALAWIRTAGDISALIAIIGIYLHQRKALNTLGLIAFAITLAAVLMLIFSFNYEMAVGIYAVGLFLVAIALLQAGIFPPWVPWMWIIAPVIGMVAFLIPNIATILFQLAAVAFGLGFIGAGYHMFFTTAPG